MNYNPRTIALATPFICLVLVGALLMWQNSNLTLANQELKNARSALDKASADRKAAEAAQSDARYAAAPSGAQEELAFVDGIRHKVQLAGLQLKSMGASLAVSLQEMPGQEKNQEKLKGIDEVSLNLTIAGPYKGVRSFLRSVTNEDRLCNIEAIRWERQDEKKQGCEASVTLSRYVTSTEGAAKP